MTPEIQDKINQLLTFVPEENRQAFGEALGGFIDSYDREQTSGKAVTQAFDAAALSALQACGTALLPLETFDRGRVLEALQTLMGPEPGPDFLTRLAEGLGPALVALPAVLAQHRANEQQHRVIDGCFGHAHGVAHAGEKPVGIGLDDAEFYKNQDAFVDYLNGVIEHAKAHGVVVVQNADGSFEFKSKT